MFVTYIHAKEWALLCNHALKNRLWISLIALMCYLPSSKSRKKALSWEISPFLRSFINKEIIIETDHHFKRFWTHFRKSLCFNLVMFVVFPLPLFTYLCKIPSNCLTFVSISNRVAFLCQQALPLDFLYFYLHSEILLVIKLGDEMNSSGLSK